MGGRRKLGLTSLLFKLGDTTTTTTTTTTMAKASSSSWAWPSCKQQPRTDSFRSIVVDGAIYKTVNSVYDSTEYSFTQSSEDNNSESLSSDNDDSENLIRGLTSSDRLLFEPGGDTSSILAKGCGSEEEAEGVIPFKESVAMAMETDDPYLDFKKSMEEMVVAHGIKDWECLEEMLVWYLMVNGKKTHGYIVGAFVDLLVGIAKVNESGQQHLPCSSSYSYSSSSAASSSLSLSSGNCYEIEEVEEGSGSC